MDGEGDVEELGTGNWGLSEEAEGKRKDLYRGATCMESEEKNIWNVQLSGEVTLVKHAVLPSQPRYFYLNNWMNLYFIFYLDTEK